MGTALVVAGLLSVVLFPLGALTRYFLHLGSFGFGGPIALTAAMQRDLVASRGWVTPQEYKEGLALAQLAPGPLAAQLAIYLGWLHYGVLGATLVAIAFVAAMLSTAYTFWNLDSFSDIFWMIPLMGFFQIALFGGYAICGANSCPNVIVRSDLPQPIGFTYPPQYLYYVTMHELGHALGLGHAQPLTESTDLMGYGWHWSNGIVPTLSECDLAGIAVVFAWALEGVDPYPPTQPSVACE